MKKYHHCVKFTYPLSFQTRIPKVDQHTGGKWLIHGTKHRKDNQLQSLEDSYSNATDKITRAKERLITHLYNIINIAIIFFLSLCNDNALWVYVCWYSKCLGEARYL